MVNGPQSAFPLPSVNDATSRSAASTALNVFDDLRRSGTKETTCKGSSASTEMSYSLSLNTTVNNGINDKRGQSYRSFPSTVITMSVEPASPHGCHSILAMGAEAEEAWKYCPTWIDLQKQDLGIKEREVHERDAYLQSMVGGTSRKKPGRGRTTTATWKAPATASSFPVGFRDSWHMLNWIFGVCRT
jgi:hypothetical protein